MTTLHPDTFRFLEDLEANNDRDWFQANKSRYDAIRGEHEAFIDALILKIGGFDSDIAGMSAKKSIMRIYRDVRFSKDKSPYNIHMSAHIVAGGRSANEHGRAGYYVRLESGKSILAGGAYLPPGEWMTRIRERIESDADELRDIVNAPAFKKYFGGITGEKLKTAPRGYAKDHPEIELLRYKSFLAVHEVSNEQALAPGFIDHATTVFKALAPFDAFLNQ